MGKYDAWTSVFRDLNDDPTTFVIDDLADLIPGGLPESAFKYQAWWASPQNHAVWRKFGWRASPNFSSGSVSFHKKARQSVVRSVVETDEVGIAERRLVLLGCVETKANHPAPAKDLYLSPLWQKRRRYAEQSGMPWRILSAEYGLVDPEVVIEPYDRYLGSEPAPYRSEWSRSTANNVISVANDLGVDVVEVHAGADYLENGLIRRLNEAGLRVLWPLRGYRFGEHLSWYDSKARTETPTLGARETGSRPSGDRAAEAHDLARALRSLADRLESFFDADSTFEETRALDEVSEQRIVLALLEYGTEIGDVLVSKGDPEFTPDPAANEFLARDPLAFLLAVIADYQIAAERAWAVPWELKKRLGHLDPELMLQDPEALYEAFDEPPKLHRFIRNVPNFFLEACRILIHEYDGDAGQIWGDEPTAVVLQSRFVAFPGISQKKAAMAVEILERDLGVTIREMEGSDLAFDVHVRRVMLRTGLATVDDQRHMIERARQLNPERPGALDFPMWNIGRTWCHAGVPDCGECVLVEVCLKLVDAASGVRGT